MSARISGAPACAHLFLRAYACLLLTLAAQGAGAQVDAGQALAECDAPGLASPLRPPPSDAPDWPARAHALDLRHLQWPGVKQEGALRLVAAWEGGLQAKLGQVPRGVDASLSLHRGAALPEVLARRFPHLRQGGVLELPAGQTLDERWLRAELLLVREDAQGRVQEASRLQLAGALDDRYAEAAEVLAYGPLFTPGQRSTRLRLWAPTAHQVQLCLYPGPESPAARVLPLHWEPASGSWLLTADEDLRGHYYRFLVDVLVPGQGLLRQRVTDPYSVSLNADSRRSFVADLDDAAWMPQGWQQHRRPAPPASATDMSIYELHVRDFSWHDASQPPALRGKFGAFAQAGALGVQHLQRLARAGMTDLHLLPVFDIASIPERDCAQPSVPPAPPDSQTQQAAVTALAARDCYNWGYDPLHYSAPEGSYASEANAGGQRLLEFRQMVMALHGLGLRVGMDVVYNHTPASGQHVHSVLDRVVPGYYQRLDAQGRVERSTCCDNTATEHRMMAKLMSDSVLLWALKHGIDSFRFDLMGHQPRAVMEAIARRLRQQLGHSVPLIGEGWDFGEVAQGARFVQASQRSLNGSGIGTFSDRARDALRGGSPGDGSPAGLVRQGWGNGLFSAPNGVAEAASEAMLQDAADLIRVGLAGSLGSYRMSDWRGVPRRLSGIAYADQPAGYASQPAEVVNYAENHDNHTLFDNHVLRLPRDASHEERVRAQLLATAVTAYSQGVAYFHAGMEILRSKSLDRNSFDSGDWFNRLDWSLQDNGFAAGLPPAPDNVQAWPLYRSLLADPAIKPRAQDIRQARDMFLDQLRVRASSRLFHLRSAAQVQQRLSFPRLPDGQAPTLLLARLDGRGLRGAGFRELLLVFNAGRDEGRFAWDDARLGWRLHPVLARPGAADAVLRQLARVDAGRREVRVPAWSAAVFVR
ncbi:alpha-1,6-glucosidase domain-containing protein [Roseateles sp. DB2]|uniref:alpha-1,6-glucosidase domain-containing protein n=1 Tax=Roseateles sp. DB2 TaxID=3453717 RepID=UPI003EEA3A81